MAIRSVDCCPVHGTAQGFAVNYRIYFGICLTWSNYKVRELVTACLLWQDWTKAFDDVDISAFHSCVVVDLWQSLSKWHLLLSACVSVCRLENVGA